MNRLLFLIMIAVMIEVSGCSSACTMPVLSGKYELRDTDVFYTLELDENHAGSLSVDGRLVGPITWEMHSENDQIFVHGSREILERLLKTRHTSIPVSSGAWTTGYFGLSARCKAFTRSVRLNLDDDGRTHFDKVESK